MEKFNLLKKVSETVENFQAERVIIPTEKIYRGSTVLNLTSAVETDKNGTVYSAKVLKFDTITSLENLPDNIIGIYMNNAENLVRLEKPVRGAFVVYVDILEEYINLTGTKAVEKLLEKVPFGARVILDNDIYPREIMWSNTLKKAYQAKYGEDICDKLALLFIDLKGSARFRSRYFSLLSTLVQETFIAPLKVKADQLYGIIDCAIGAVTQILPNNSNMSFAEKFDGIILEYSAENLLGENLKRNVELVGNTVNKNIIASIKREDYEELSLNDIKNIIDRLYALGLERFCIDGIEQDIKYQSICEYVSYLRAALSAGVTVKDTLVVYPTYTAYSLFNITNGKSVVDFNRQLRCALADLSSEGYLYDVINENSLKEVQFVGGKVRFFDNEYSKLIMLDMGNVSFATANFFADFLKAGGKVYTLGKKVRLIDGVVSARIKDINKKIAQLDRLRLKLLKNSYSPAVSTNAHIRVMRLPDTTFTYFVANIVEDVTLRFNKAFEIAKLDLIEKSEYSVGSFGQVSLSPKDDTSVLLHTVKGNTIKRNSRYVNFEEEFILKGITENILPIDRCRWRTGKQWQDECKLSTALEHLKLSGSAKAELEFCFIVTEKENISFALKIEGGQISKIEVNEKEASSGDITSFVTLGQNKVVLTLTGYDIFRLFISGNFSVQSNSNFFFGEKGAIITEDDFYIASLPKTVSISKITQSGFWFFDGAMTLSQKVDIGKKLRGIYKLGFRAMNAQLLSLQINTIPAGNIAFAPYEKDVSDLLYEGENNIDITVYAEQKNRLARDCKYKNTVICEPFGCALRPRTPEIIYFEDDKIHNKTKDSNTITVREGELAVISVNDEKIANYIENKIVNPKNEDENASAIKRIATKIKEYLFTKRDISVISMDCELRKNLTVGENVALGKNRKSPTFQGVIRTLGLGEIKDLSVEELSLEQVRRTMLAAAVYSSVKVIVCNLSNITEDDKIFDTMLEICKNYEKTIVVITRDMNSCEKADRFVSIEERQAKV